MDNQLFRDIQTDLDLNGPILSFSTQPVDTTINVGQTATFTAIATVSFPGDSSPANTGTIAYQWYGPNGILTEGTKYVGTKTTTLQITNVTSPADVGAYYVVLDYVPSSNTGNALNEPLKSNSGNLIAPPLIEIIAQPTPITTISSTDNNFNINATLTDNGTDIGFQWQLDGENVSDGTVTKSTVQQIPGTTQRAVSQSVGGGGARNVIIPVGAKNILFNVCGGAGGDGGGNFDNFAGGEDRIGGPGGAGMEGWFHLGDNFYHGGNPNLGLGNQLYIGLSGGLKGSDGVVGSSTGASGGKTNTPSYPSHLLAHDGNRVTGAPREGQSNGGNGGAHGFAIITGTGTNRSSGDAGGGGGGGGASYVTIQGSIAAIAGGGGGGGGAFNNGPALNATGSGHPGGDAGPVRTSPGPHNFTPNTMQWVEYLNVGMAQTPGGNGVPGHDGNGIDTPGGGGGGAGSPGGGGGHHGHRPNGSPGGNPGFSGYASNFVRYRSGSYNPRGNGWASVHYTVDDTAMLPTTVTRTTTISGSSTNQLTLNTDGPGIGYTVSCSVNSSIASNSPVTSDEVPYQVESTVDTSDIVVEGIGFNNSLANVSTTDLSNGELTLDTIGNGFVGPAPTIQLYSFYAPNSDVNIEMDLYGGGSSDGRDGEGGFARIRFTMERNLEYVIAGLTDNVNTPFLYRGGSLMACVGEGGKTFKGQQRGGITSARGLPAGDGGGINMAGGDAKDLWFGGGGGGPNVGQANLRNDGKFGSAYIAPFVYPEDRQSGDGTGGHTIRCTKGVYWREQGASPCEFVGRGVDGNIHNSQFRLSDGTVVTNTGSILRGYKAGYNIIQTAGGGRGEFRGGNGASGGNGGVGQRPGGGGSGYGDGSFTIVSTTQGGSTGFAKVVIRKLDDSLISTLP